MFGNRAGVAILVACLFCISCASGHCVARDRSSPILKINYLSGGDGPNATTLTLFDDRVELDFVRWKTYCKKADSSLIAKVGKLLDEDTIRQLEPSEHLGHHLEEIHVYRGAEKVYFVRGEIPEEAKGALQLVDQLFIESFGGRYDFRLVGPAPWEQ